MKKTLGCLRRADDRFKLIEPGDGIVVGISGGKDSLLLLQALSTYRLFSKKDYRLFAVTIDMGLRPFDLEPVRKMCEGLNVPYTVVETKIGQIVFDVRQEKNPCGLCANLRRGALNSTALSLGCNKVALGHNREDVLETLLLSILYEGRLAAMSPKSYLDRSGITLIRPLALLPEKHIISLARRLSLPVQPSPCPAAGHTKRQEMKELLQHMANLVPDAEDKLMGALLNTDQYSLWDIDEGQD